MIARSLSETVVFSKPFLLRGVDRTLPAIDVENDVLRHGAPPCVLTDLR